MMSVEKSAFAAYNGKKGSKPKNVAKTNGIKGQNGAKSKAKANSKSKLQPASSANDSFDDMDSETLEDLVKNNQSEKLQSYMMAQLEGSGSDDNFNDEDEFTESGSELEWDTDSADDSSGSDDDGSDADSNDEDNSEDEFTEYTLNTPETSPGVSSKESTPAPKGQKAAKKRGHTNAKDEEVNNNDSKPMKARKVQQEDLALAGRIQERKSMVAAPATTKPASCPLRRSLPASGSQAKSCPLPKKSKQQSGAELAKLVPLSATDEKATFSGAAEVAKICPLPSKTEKPQATEAAAAKFCPLPSKAIKQITPRVCLLSDKPKATSTQVQVEAKNRKNTKNVEVATASTSETAGNKEVHLQNSIEEGRRALGWLIHPMGTDSFFKDFWEKNACLVQRYAPSYFSDLISFEMIDQMMLHHHLEFTTNIDVTSYKDGVRTTLNPEGRAMPPTVWGFYGEGCSLRILNPSTYLPGLRALCASMQEFFHCLVGANVYLTPPNSQGFAPHFDDIEAFVVQVEGRKRWRLYKPLQTGDILARVSSGNYTPDQLGEPIFDQILQPGDLLYFPRGTVHQAVTEKNHHSLHITLSVYQQQAYANLLEKLVPIVLQKAIKESIGLRRGLPLNTWQHLGLAHGATTSDNRTKLIKDIQEMVQKHLTPSEEQIDAAVDQLAKRYHHEALPPNILPEEKLRTVFGSQSATDANGKCLCDYELTEQTAVRLLRANILRVVADDNHLRVYYYVDNAMEYCKYDPTFIEIKPTEAAAVETLMHAYPAYVKISSLPLRSAQRRIEVATALWERGLLMTEKPFK